jgi:DNA-binding transcriptional LysR family regulator
MDLRQMRYFVAVAEERHFRRAAERLHMSQPPLSQQIQALEEELGAKLFVRDKRSVQLTAAGEALLRRSRAIIEQAASAATETRQVARGEMGRIVLGVMSSAMLGRLVTVLERFRAQAPGVVVDVVQLPPKEQLDATAMGRIDLGFLAIEPLPPHARGDSLVTAKSWEEELVLALPATHALARRKTVSVRELRHEKFITLPRMPETGHHDQVVHLCRVAGFRPVVAQEVEQLPVALALIGAGYGISLVPACVMEDWRHLTVFVRLKERPRIPVTMAWRPGNDSPVLALFLRVVADCRMAAPPIPARSAMR